MTTVTWAWKPGNGVEEYWDQAVNWSTGSLPSPGDEVVIPKGGAALVFTGDAIAIASIDVSGALGIDGGTFATTGGLTIAAGAGLEVDDPPLTSPDTTPASVTIGGIFSNSGHFVSGSTATITIGTFDNTATGFGGIGGSVTVTDLINSGGQSGDFLAGAGSLTVTGTFTNSGAFRIGEFSVPASETMKTAALDNEATGRITITNAAVTIGNVDNKAVATSETATNGIYVDFDDGVGDHGSLLHVTGTFTNAGALIFGGAEGGTTATIATLDNTATGDLGVDDASVTVGKVTNAGRSEGDTFAGFGVDYHSGETTGFETGGSLTVTGEFINTGDFAVGDVSTDNVASTTTVTIGTLDNRSTGGINILAGTVTVGTFTNAGAPSQSVSHAGVGIDNLPGQPGGGDLTVTGVLTNTGDFVIGNNGMTGSATVTAGTLANSDGKIELIAGAASSQATLKLQATPATWKGDLRLAGGTSGIAGTALLVMEDNGEIVRIAAGGGIGLIGDQAFVADADDTSASSALARLATINGGLDLEQGAEVTVGRGLTNNGIAIEDGGIGADIETLSAASSLTIDGELKNHGDTGVGNIEAAAVDDEVALTVGALDNTENGSIGIINAAVEVKGELTNTGVGTGNGIGLDIAKGAAGGSLTVDGRLTNSGVIGIGNASDDGSTTATLGTLDNTASGSIGVTGAALTVTGEATNAGVGGGFGIGVDLAAGSGGGSLTVGGVLTNRGDIAIGNNADAGSTTLTLGDLDNEATGSIAIDDAAATVTGSLTNAGAGTRAGIENGISVDIVDGASGGSLEVKGKVTNSGDLGFGNADDDGSTTITLAGLDNEAAGAIGILNAAVTVTGNLSNAGTGTGNGIAIGAEDGSTASDLTVTGALKNSGIIAIGDAGQALVTTKEFTNTGLVDIDFGSTTSVPTVAVAKTYTEAAGSPGLTNVDGVLEAFAVSVTGGTLDGAGLIVAAVENTGGKVQAGQNLTTPGTLTIGGAAPGAYTQGRRGTLSELVAGVGAGQFGVIEVNGAVSLAGLLAIAPVNGFKFAAGQSFDIVNFTEKDLKGTFSTIDVGTIKGNSHDVLLGSGLALVANYENAKGQIDLDIVSTTVSVATFKSEEPVLNLITTGFAVVDTAQNIEQGLAALEADTKHIKSVSLTGASPVLDLTQAQAVKDAALLRLIGTPYVLEVTHGKATRTTGNGNDLTIRAVGTDDTITAGGSGETFLFNPAFGHDAITDFAAHDAGAGHDVISLPKTDFSSFAALSKATSNVGGNVVIATQNRDRLTLDNLTVSALNGLAPDFKFHA